MTFLAAELVCRWVSREHQSGEHQHSHTPIKKGRSDHLVPGSNDPEIVEVALSPRQCSGRRIRAALTLLPKTRPFVGHRATALTDPAASATDLLLRASRREPDAVNSIFPVVYAELRRVAHLQLRGEDTGHTLTTTALVHEAYLRLVDQTRTGWSDRAHFLAIAATAMRRILVDHARQHRRQKRGGALRREWLDMAVIPAPDRAELLVALDEELEVLASLSPRQAKVVECRFFGGMTAEETAEALGIGVRTVKREWTKARSWLYQQLYPEAT